MRWTAPIRANGPPRRLASTGTCSVGFRPVLSHCPLHCPLTHAPSAHPSSACTARPRRSTALPDRPASDAAADPPAPPCAVAARERRTRLPPPLFLSRSLHLSLSRLARQMGMCRRHFIRPVSILERPSSPASHRGLSRRGRGIAPPTDRSGAGHSTARPPRRTRAVTGPINVGDGSLISQMAPAPGRKIECSSPPGARGRRGGGRSLAARRTHAPCGRGSRARTARPPVDSREETARTKAGHAREKGRPAIAFIWPLTRSPRPATARLGSVKLPALDDASYVNTWSNGSRSSTCLSGCARWCTPEREKTGCTQRISIDSSGLVKSGRLQAPESTSNSMIKRKISKSESSVLLFKQPASIRLFQCMETGAGDLLPSVGPAPSNNWLFDRATSSWDGALLFNCTANTRRKFQN